MEPLKPEVKKRILETTDATPQDIEEYEGLQVKLHARRMARAHDLARGIAVPQAAVIDDREEKRAIELHAKFFGSTDQSEEPGGSASDSND